MNIYFLRHAEAADSVDDFSRELTPKGESQSKIIGRFLAERDIVFDAAYTSPLVRAVQTAEIVMECTNKKSGVLLQKSDLLKNDPSPKVFDEWLTAMKNVEHVLLVGHNPSLSDHVSRMLGIRSPFCMSLSKGALAVIRRDSSSSAQLKLFITPKSASTK